jgi:hypothetical protein
LTLERRFGDSFAPDLSELSVSGESLWASGSSPATGAFALAEAALQAALAQGPREKDGSAIGVGLSQEEASGRSTEGSTELSKLLQGSTSGIGPDAGD